MPDLQASQVAKDMVKRFESCRLTPYLDATNNVTIGWGHKCIPGSPLAVCKDITQLEADKLLDVDIKATITGIQKFTYVSLTQPQIDALTSLVYNIGVGNFFKSSLRKHLNLSDYHSAADQFLVWDEINGHHNHWQAQRRLAEHDLFLKGTK